MNLFNLGEFKLHSGQISKWKIDCDYLSWKDWETLAYMATQILPPFGEVEGVPQGGYNFARALRVYSTTGPLLICDDVLTTGKSMKEMCNDKIALGIVVFARGPCPAWIKAIFQMSEFYTP